MKLLIATGLYPPEIGGPATFAKQFEVGLAARGISYITIPFRIVRGYPKGIRHLVYFLKLFFILKRGDTVCALDPVSVGLPALLSAQLRGANFYVRIGGDYAWEQGMQRFGISDLPDKFLETYAHTPHSFPFLLRVLIRIERFVAVHAQNVVVQSSYLASIVERWGVPKERIAIVPNGMEALQFSSSELSRHACGWNANETVILSAGRLVPWKGFSALIAAADIVSREHKNLLLVIAGDGPEYTALKEQAQKVEQKSSLRVVFSGRVPREKLLDMMHGANVFALNTGYEGFSHQILEAFAARVPVVTTTIGGNADLVEHEHTALAVGYNDRVQLAAAISRILSDTVLASTLSREACTRAHTYTLERMVEETCKALALTLGAHVLMMSGDSQALIPQRAVHQRLLLQAAETNYLTVYVPASNTKEITLGEHGIVRGFSGNKYAIARAMVHTARSESLSVVTAQDPFFLGYIAWCIARKRKVPLQLQVHTDIFAPAFRKHALLRWLLARFLLRQADGIRVVSSVIKDSLTRAGIRAPISVLPIFIDREAIICAPSFSFQSYGFSHVILVVARLEKEKRVADAIHALPHILEAFPNAGLIIAGDGTQKKSLEMLVQTYGIEKSVVFLGIREDVFSLYKGAQCCIAATADFEGYGATVVEALAAECPVISYDHGIAKEAGAIIVPESGIASAVIRLLQSNHHMGVLRLSLPSAKEWAEQWYAGIRNLLK